MNLKTGGTALVVGAVGGVLANTQAPLTLLAPTVPSLHWGLVTGAVALVGGIALQSAMPFTQPDIVDGLVDGGLALVGFEGAKLLIAPVTGAAGWAAHQVGPAFAGLYGSVASPCARGSLGGIPGGTKRSLV